MGDDGHKSTGYIYTGGNVILTKGHLSVFGGKRVAQIAKPQVLDIPTYDGSGQCTHPSVLYFPSSFGGFKYWMAFTPYPDFDTSKENPSIVCSNDGVTWDTPPGLSNPLAGPPELGFYADTSLVYDGVNLHIYWAHSGITPRKTYRISSANGVVWGEAVEVTHLQGADVRFLGSGRWESWNLSTAGELTRRVSVDGITFSLPSRVPTNLVGGMGHVMVYSGGSGYHFLAISFPPDRDYRSGALYYGYSETGASVFFDAEPLLNPTAGTWYEGGLYTSSMIPEGDDVYSIYVSGFAGSVARIGRVQIKVSHHINPVTLSGSKAHQTRNVVLFSNYEVRSATLAYSPLLPSGRIPQFNDYPNKTITFYNTHNKSIDLRFVCDFAGFVLSAYKGLPTQVLQEITIPAGASLFRMNILDNDDLKILGKMYAGDVRIGIKANNGADLPTAGDITMGMTMWA